MNDYIAATEAEEQRLTDELSRNPTFVKLQAVRVVLEAYRSAGKPMSMVATTTRALEPATRVAGARAGSLAARIRPVVVDYLGQKGGRAQTAELLEVVTKAGIEIGGQKPSGVLSSYLSNMKDELDHKHGEGYGLRTTNEVEKGEPSNTEVTPPSSPKPAKLDNDAHSSGGVFGHTKVEPIQGLHNADFGPVGTEPDGNLQE